MQVIGYIIACSLCYMFLSFVYSYTKISVILSSFLLKSNFINSMLHGGRNAIQVNVTEDKFITV